ncbi:uncharacterized protein LOC134289580 [Aedes albopictus]|uniref:PHD-type domain-containing protein n=1 Tax=Aedes albopictus TaxID=7160 RepID=A0ABM1ZJT3_AEDAL
MSNRSHEPEATPQTQGIQSSTPTDKCKICQRADQGRLWKCNICRNWNHPACIGIESTNENDKFVCPQCQPLTGALKHTFVAPPVVVPASTTPIEYVNMSWSQISPVTTLTSTTPMFVPPNTVVDSRTIMPRYSIAPSSSCPSPFPPTNQAFRNTFPILSNLAQALPPYQLPSYPAAINQPCSRSQFISPGVIVSIGDAMGAPTVLPPPSVAIQCTNNAQPVHPLTITQPYSTTQFVPPGTAHLEEAMVSSEQLSSSLPNQQPAMHNPPSILRGAIPSAVIVSSGEPIPTAPTMLPPSDARNNQSLVRADARSQVSKATGSRLSTRQQQKQLELELLDEQRKLQEEEEANKREYLRKRYELLQEMASETSSTSGVSVVEDGPNEKVNAWLQSGIPNRNMTQTLATSQVQYFGPTGPASGVPRDATGNLMGNITRSSQQECRQQHALHDDSRAPTRSIRFANTGEPNFDPVQRSTPRHISTRSEYGNNLTHNQVAARQAISRELPIFDGSPEEWPLFYSTFNSTTEMCGYTQEENLIRLQKGLKGKAYDAVKCRLMHPANVPGIIATL